MEAFAYIDYVSLGLMRITADTVRPFAFLQRELKNVGNMLNPAKTIALPPKGYAPTAEISLLESVDVRIAGEGGATVVGVPLGTDEYVLDQAMEVVRTGGADRLARCLARMPDKHTAALIAIESLGQRTSYLERALDTGLSLEACRMADHGVQWAYGNILELPLAAEAQSFFQEGCPGTADSEPLSASPSTPFHWSGRVRAAVDDSETNVCLHWTQGGDRTGGSCRHHESVRRPSEDGAP